MTSLTSHRAQSLKRKNSESMCHLYSLRASKSFNVILIQVNFSTAVTATKSPLRHISPSDPLTLLSRCSEIIQPENFSQATAAKSVCYFFQIPYSFQYSIQEKKLPENLEQLKIIHEQQMRCVFRSQQKHQRKICLPFVSILQVPFSSATASSRVHLHTSELDVRAPTSELDVCAPFTGSRYFVCATYAKGM